MLTMTQTPSLGHDHMMAPNVGAQLVGIDGCGGCSATLVGSGSMFGLSASSDQLEATADGLISGAGGASMVSFIQIENAMSVLDKTSAKMLGQFLIAKGVSASSVNTAFKNAFPTPSSGRSIWAVLATASAAASAYHGYIRNDSIGWALVWFMLGGLFPVITPVIAVAQGFGQPK